jgi:hypothetical protein
MKDKLDKLIRNCKNSTPGPWALATSNSWRRYVDKMDKPILTPVVAPDGHPDLSASQFDLEFVEQASRYHQAALEALRELWQQSEWSDEGHVRVHGELPSTLVQSIIEKHLKDA